MRETNGKEPFEFLSWRGKDEILFLPYYDTLREAGLNTFSNFQLPPANVSSPRNWLNIPPVKVVHEETSNTFALQHLLQGADGVLFDVRNKRNPDLNALTNNIEWPSCSIQFYAQDDDFLPLLSNHIEKNNFSPASVTGALFWESVPKKSNFDLYIHSCRNYRALGLLIAPSSPAGEISDALFNGVKTIETFSHLSDPRHVFRSIAFSLPADATMLECIAKFKALRMLWFQVAIAYGMSDYKVGEIHLHARSQAIPDATLGPHENMLKGTFSAMAAILGGCDSLSVESEGEAPFLSRWARNVSLILQEESFFTSVADPLAGATALDSITHALAAKAWQLFQEKWMTYAKT